MLRLRESVMLSNTAMKAAQIRMGIETCKDVSSSNWRTIIDRIIYDLDESGNTAGVAAVRSILAEAWEGLPDRPEMKGFLAGQVEDALPPVLDGEGDGDGQH
jgi:hypothetical protein